MRIGLLIDPRCKRDSEEHVLFSGLVREFPVRGVSASQFVLYSKRELLPSVETLPLGLLESIPVEQTVVERALPERFAPLTPLLMHWLARRDQLDCLHYFFPVSSSVGSCVNIVTPRVGSEPKFRLQPQQLAIVFSEESEADLRSSTSTDSSSVIRCSTGPHPRLEAEHARVPSFDEYELRFGGERIMPGFVLIPFWVESELDKQFVAALAEACEQKLLVDTQIVLWSSNKNLYRSLRQKVKKHKPQILLCQDFSQAALLHLLFHAGLVVLTSNARDFGITYNSAKAEQKKVLLLQSAKTSASRLRGGIASLSASPRELTQAIVSALRAVTPEREKRAFLQAAKQLEYVYRSSGSVKNR